MLKPRQVRAATLLAQGLLCKEVAKAVGVSAQTISNWQKNLHFEALVNRTKLEMLEASRAQMQGLARLAVATVENILQGGGSDAIKLKAAEVVFAHAGLTQGHTDLWRWGIGPLSARDVAAEHASNEQDKRMAEMIRALG
jgi:transcriptional regulator with XRE-family HTH domain